MTEQRLLVILAHPDDESLISGTMARYADAGVGVTMLCATRGEVGEIAPGTGATPATLAAYREQELRDACALLGVADVRFLEFRDSGMAGTPENEDPRSLNQAAAGDVVAPMVRAIRELRPDAIVTWDETGGYGHPDHMRVHQCATAAFESAADPRYDGEGEPWRAPALYFAIFPMEEFGAVMTELRARGIDVGEAAPETEAAAVLSHAEPNCVIDVGAQIERKFRAIEAHRTQAGSFGPFSDLPEDLRVRLFSREYFYRAQPALAAGAMLEDLFADMER